ncbi:MAG: tetratricopeptide repeat protein, partial [Gemmatimonadales bacterium]
YEGEAMVMDFGIAKAVSVAGADTLTQTGMMVGTPAYVSPEQAAGETNLDGRSDQYSLGCVIYEMLSGERAFSGPTAQSVMAKRFTETAKPLRTIRITVPESVEKAVARAMSTDADSRYKSAAQFAQALASGTLTTPSDTATMPQQVVASAKSVAVLPFSNMSNDAENEYFADGMAEEIINALSKIQSLRVASRTVSFALKGKNEDLAEVGKKLHVSTVLDGSVRRMGNRLRITAQLVNVADGYQLWSERYDREMEDVFAIQDDISQAIVKALRVILTEGEKKQIEKVRAVNVQAYDYYLRGRQYFHQLRRKSIEYAKQMFNKAIEIDPEYARAHAGVADCYSLLYTYFDAREFNLRQADISSSRALELEPDLAEAHVARGLAVSLSKRFDEAEREFETALKLDPKLFEAAYWFARARLSQGRYEEAAKLMERAVAIRPEENQTWGFLGQALTGLGKHDEAAAAYKRQVKLIDEHLELNPDDPRACILAAVANAIIGDKERAVQFAQQAMLVDPEDPMLLYNVACTYAQLAMPDESLGALEKAVEKGWGDKNWIEHDSDLDSIRSSPRYKAIVQAM